jgi:hypothetical protein
MTDPRGSSTRETVECDHRDNTLLLPCAWLATRDGTLDNKYIGFQESDAKPR